MSAHLHFGVVWGSGPDPSFLGYSNTRHHIIIQNLLTPVGYDVNPMTVHVDGSWEVWGTDDQRGHKSLHLVVDLDDDHPSEAFVGAIYEEVKRWAVGRVVDVAIETTEVWAEKVRIFDLSRPLMPYSYSVNGSDSMEAVRDAAALDDLADKFHAGEDAFPNDDLIEYVGTLLERTGRR